MHRVELKDFFKKPFFNFLTKLGFLMHRVELKVILSRLSKYTLLCS